MYSKSRSVILSLAVIGLGLTVGGRGADDDVGSWVGNEGSEGSLGASLMAVLAETVGSTAAYPQTRRNCETARQGTRIRRCIQRTAWNFTNQSNTNFDPQLTPDGRFVVFGSREVLDENRDDDTPLEDEFGIGSATVDIFLQDLEMGRRPLRVSVDEHGNIVTNPSAPSRPSQSFSPAVSADGRLVAFATEGAFLPEKDLNGESLNDEDDVFVKGDVYRKDVVTGELILVSAAPGSPPGPAVGGVPLTEGAVAMSDNGRFVAFLTRAPLDDRDKNNDDDDPIGGLDVYVRNLETGEYFLASILVDLQGSISAGGADLSSIDISANGRFVAFASRLPLNPTDNDPPTNGDSQFDVYIWDRFNPDAAPVLASGNADPQLQSIGRSLNPSLSANGRFVAFESEAALVANDNNGVSDIYRYRNKRVTDQVDRKIIRVSVDARGRETALEGSQDPTISANGRFIAFSSAAGDLVLNDTSFGPISDSLGLPVEDIFVKDLRTGAITRASVDEDGIETDGTSFSPSLSADGTLITFLTDDAGIILPPESGGLEPGDAVVVTAVDFAALPAVDIPGAPPGAPSIDSLDFALRNTIDRQGDQDWFRVALTAGTTYVIDLEGRPSRQGTLDDPLLRIFVPKIPGVDLDLADQDDDSGQGLNARLRYEARATGDYFISAEGFGAATGTYRLLVREQ